MEYYAATKNMSHTCLGKLLLHDIKRKVTAQKCIYNMITTKLNFFSFFCIFKLSLIKHIYKF